jgi:hypothetical protein
VAEIVGDGGDDAATATRWGKEPTGEHNGLHAVRMRDCKVQRVNRTE